MLLCQQIKKLRENCEHLRQLCSQGKENIIEDAISKLPENQQAAVRTCFQASKLSNKKNIRYTTQWMYECLLLRIKSKKCYEHLRRRNILTLPSISTLSKYMARIKTSFGFHSYVFKCLREKVIQMSPGDRRGVYL